MPLPQSDRGPDLEHSLGRPVHGAITATHVNSGSIWKSGTPMICRVLGPHPGRGPVKLSGLEIQQRSAALRINRH
jgi:hypothetical protein